MRHGSFTRGFNCTTIRQIVQQSPFHYQSCEGINSSTGRGWGMGGALIRRTAEQLINTLFCTYKLSSLINNMDYDWNMI